jgi:hypothetical protein
MSVQYLSSTKHKDSLPLAQMLYIFIVLNGFTHVKEDVYWVQLFKIVTNEKTDLNWPKCIACEAMWWYPLSKKPKTDEAIIISTVQVVKHFSVPWKSSIKDQNQELVFQRCMSTSYHKCIDWTDKKTIPWKHKFQNDCIYSRILLKEEYNHNPNNFTNNRLNRPPQTRSPQTSEKNCSALYTTISKET